MRCLRLPAALLLPLLLLALAPLRGASAAGWDGTVKCYLGFINDTFQVPAGGGFYSSYYEQCLPDPAPFRTLAASSNALDK